MNNKLSAIVAVCDDWGIGLNGDMIVENRADMRHFVRLTKGHTVIMGRKTLESFPGGRPLKDRRNIVLTRDPEFTRDGVAVAHAVDEALALLDADEEAWVVGGAEVYRQFLPHCTCVVVTKNHCVRAADTFFPNLDEDHGGRIWWSPDKVTRASPMSLLPTSALSKTERAARRPGRRGPMRCSTLARPWSIACSTCWRGSNGCIRNHSYHLA